MQGPKMFHASQCDLPYFGEEGQQLYHEGRHGLVPPRGKCSGAITGQQLYRVCGTYFVIWMP